jgi:hypothetical protein
MQWFEYLQEKSLGKFIFTFSSSVLGGEACEDGWSMPVLSGRISNRVYLQEKPASFVEGFLTVYTYRRSRQILWKDF